MVSILRLNNIHAVIEIPKTTTISIEKQMRGLDH